MAHTLEQFAKSCRSALESEPGPAGRKKVCAILQEVLKDDEFIKTNFSDKTPERQILHEDPDWLLHTCTSIPRAQRQRAA